MDVLLLDMTGAITFGNRQAVEFLPTDAAQLASLADETPEGHSPLVAGFDSPGDIVAAKSKHGLRGRAVQKMHATFIPFSVQTRISSINLDGQQIRKGATDAIEDYVKQRGGKYLAMVRQLVEGIPTDALRR